jgi:hypothetical protein
LFSLFASLNNGSNGENAASGRAAALVDGRCHKLVKPRSNATHIVWWLREGTENSRSTDRFPSEVQRKLEGNHSNDESSCFWIQTRQHAEQDCLQFLKDNVMAFDRPFLETMGFPSDEDVTSLDLMEPDGLDYGMVQPTIRLALDAKVQYPWTDDLPRDIFQDYVLNYANLNEARTNWRPLLVDALRFNTSDLYQSGQANISSVTTWVNRHLWTKLARDPSKPIFFKSSQTPLIFDPMSTIAFGFASCTGTSILFCNALRAVGIPARVVGTAAWYGDRSKGNHNWVEVFVGENENGEDPWKFLEPSPALPNVDTLDATPCGRWFCDSSRYPSSKVYAAKMSKASLTKSEDMCFPLAWEWDCKDVPALNRTEYYTKVCGSCHDH